MREFESYHKFVWHARIFNTVLNSVFSSAICYTIGMLLYNCDVFNNDNTYGILMVLIGVPFLVFFATLFNTTPRVACYKVWSDVIHGFLDRKKLLKQFNRTYNINNYNLKDARADGRWKFHGDTRYIKKLANEHEHIISQLRNELEQVNAELDRQLISLEKTKADSEIELDKLRVDKMAAESLLACARMSAEIYVQRRNLSDKSELVTSAETNVETWNADIRRIHNLKSVNLENFREAKTHINNLFDDRYERYIELAVKKLNKISGLKYDIKTIVNDIK